MEQPQSPSLHEVKVFMALTHEWATSQEIAQRAGVAPRTARAHLPKLAQLRVAEVAEVFPGHRYRLAHGKAKYAATLQQAVEIFGLV